MPADSQAAYQGLSGQVWGSHVYYESTKAANKQHGVLRRPVTLSRDNGPNWRAEDLQGQCLAGAGSPAHHRFPIWWTGDGVPLMASVGSMVAGWESACPRPDAGLWIVQSICWGGFRARGTV